ncbi:TetR/AcrR family transcriptional regulator [Streptomyces tricolor]|nr:TetR/AcrR family transcriptional regulator [Streptomyces tricolor]
MLRRRGGGRRPGGTRSLSRHLRGPARPAPRTGRLARARAPPAARPFRTCAPRPRGRGRLSSRSSRSRHDEHGNEPRGPARTSSLAAARRFDRHGYDGTALNHICAGAGVTLGALTFHFRSKAALASAVVDEGVRALQRIRTARPDTGRPLHDLTVLVLRWPERCSTTFCRGLPRAWSRRGTSTRAGPGSGARRCCGCWRGPSSPVTWPPTCGRPPPRIWSCTW